MEPDPDPFKHFDEKQQSWEGLQAAKTALLAEARELQLTHPDFEVVGLVAEADSSEAAPFLAALHQATGQPAAARGVMLLLPRDFIVAILKANAPAMLGRLPPSRTANGNRLLPLCAATKNGYRFDAVGYEP